jgi:hypothetical protein
MPNPPPENPEQTAARRWLESGQRLKSRLQKQIAEVASATRLIADRPELGAPNVFVEIQGQFVQVNVQLRNEGIPLLPVTGRGPALRAFVQELEDGIHKVADANHLVWATGPGNPPHALPVESDRLPVGFHVYLRRLD